MSAVATPRRPYGRRQRSRPAFGAAVAAVAVEAPSGATGRLSPTRASLPVRSRAGTSSSGGGGGGGVSGGGVQRGGLSWRAARGGRGRVTRNVRTRPPKKQKEQKTGDGARSTSARWARLSNRARPCTLTTDGPAGREWTRLPTGRRASQFMRAPPAQLRHPGGRAGAVLHTGWPPVRTRRLFETKLFRPQFCCLRGSSAAPRRNSTPPPWTSLLLDGGGGTVGSTLHRQSLPSLSPRFSASTPLVQFLSAQRRPTPRADEEPGRRPFHRLQRRPPAGRTAHLSPRRQ